MLVVSVQTPFQFFTSFEPVPLLFIPISRRLSLVLISLILLENLVDRSIVVIKPNELFFVGTILLNIFQITTIKPRRQGLIPVPKAIGHVLPEVGLAIVSQKGSCDKGARGSLSHIDIHISRVASSPIHIEVSSPDSTPLHRPIEVVELRSDVSCLIPRVIVSLAGLRLGLDGAVLVRGCIPSSSPHGVTPSERSLQILSLASRQLLTVLSELGSGLRDLLVDLIHRLKGTPEL